MARVSDFADKKHDVLQWIADSSDVPTVRELAQHFGVAAATMHSWLGKLQEEGLVAWEPGRHRSLRISPEGFQLLSSLAKP